MKREDETTKAIGRIGRHKTHISYIQVFCPGHNISRHALFCKGTGVYLVCQEERCSHYGQKYLVPEVDVELEAFNEEKREGE